MSRPSATGPVLGQAQVPPPQQQQPQQQTQPQPQRTHLLLLLLLLLRLLPLGRGRWLRATGRSGSARWGGAAQCHPHPPCFSPAAERAESGTRPWEGLPESAAPLWRHVLRGTVTRCG